MPVVTELPDRLDRARTGDAVREQRRPLFLVEKYLNSEIKGAWVQPVHRLCDAVRSERRSGSLVVAEHGLRALRPQRHYVAFQYRGGEAGVAVAGGSRHAVICQRRIDIAVFVVGI